MTVSKKLRIGVCGVGSIGFRHARLLSGMQDIELAACDPVSEHLDAVSKFGNIIGLTNSYQELLENGLDGVIVATPDRFHVDQAEAAVKKGIAVLIEKPIAENSSQAERLLKYEAEGAKILAGYPLRHNSIFQKGKELLESGKIGSPVSFHIMLGAYATLIAAKNRFTDGLKNTLFVDYSHEWDYLHWFLGNVDKVAATAQTAGELERMQSPNVVNAVIDMNNGVSGTAHLDYVQLPGQREFVVVGDRGKLSINAVQGTVKLRPFGEDYEQIYSIAETFDGMMTKQLEHFCDVINGKKEAAVTVYDGINALKTADAMIRSVDTGAWQKV